VNKAINAFPKYNECFDGYEGFLSFKDGKNTVLLWKNFENDNILTIIVNFDDYIEHWKNVLNELKNIRKNEN